MTHSELLNSLQSLPAEEQFAIATQVLDGLQRDGRLPLSDEVKRLLDERLQEADEHPERLIPAEQVFDELMNR